MNDGTYRRLAEIILVAHQRRDDSNCMCGGLELGESWATHVAEILDKAGALRDSPPIELKVDTLGDIHRSLRVLVRKGASVEAIRWVADNQLTGD